MPRYRALTCLLYTFDSALTLDFTDGEVEDMIKQLESIKSMRQKLKSYQLLDMMENLEGSRLGKSSLERNNWRKILSQTQRLQ